MIRSFGFSSTPQLSFGRGKLAGLVPSIKVYGSPVLIVTGATSFVSSVEGQQLMDDLRHAGVTFAQYKVNMEPSPGLIDEAVERFAPFNPGCVVAIGGGSALDAGKAISAMLPLCVTVKDYLEGVGKLQHPGTKIAFIAVPTTSGTGSEATKNAVLSETGENGYKRSLRHNNFVPDLAIVDPQLTLSCPPAVTAASGMDAFTQLLESFLSTEANPMTDALALEGLRLVSKSLMASYDDGQNADARTAMSLAAFLSGITLANAGLGVVHGFASSVGGYFHIPHGIICSTLMASSNRVTVRKLRSEKRNPEALIKYSVAGKIFSEQEHRSDDYYVDSFLSTIESWTHSMRIPTLASLGVGPEHFQKIVSKTDSKNNPVKLTADEMIEVLTMDR